MEHEYSEEILEGVRENLYCLSDTETELVAKFLENLADSLYKGEVLTSVAAALRDVHSGVA